MASFILSRSLLVLLLMVIALFSRISMSEATSSFSFMGSNKNESFESKDISLYGSAKLFDNGSSVQLTDSVSHGGGRVVYKKPIESMATKSEYFTGFSTFFSFSMSPGHGGRLGFFAFPANGTFDRSVFEVKFDFSENFTKFRDSNVTVIVDGAMFSEKINNITILLEKEKKEKLVLSAWINYQAGSKFLEVWVGKRFKAVDSLYYSRISLLTDEFMVGIKSYSGNFDLHSWSLETRHFPKYMHSYAVIMEQKRIKEEEKRREEEEAKRKRVWEIVTGLVTTVGSLGLVFFAMMQIWAAFKRNNLVKVMQEECGIRTKEFEYEKMVKMEVVMSKADAKQETK